MKKQTNIECSFCEHGWNCRSKLKWVTCPSCLQKTLNTTLVGKVNKDESLLIGGADMNKKTKLKFVCYEKVLKEYPLVGFDKGETGAIRKSLSVKHNVPESCIRVEVD
jgi:hypothetical protein